MPRKKQQPTLRGSKIQTLRRIMPSDIAKDIVGVSPMTGPTSNIFHLRDIFDPRLMDQKK